MRKKRKKDQKEENKEFFIQRKRAHTIRDHFHRYVTYQLIYQLFFKIPLKDNLLLLIVKWLQNYHIYNFQMHYPNKKDIISPWV